MANYIKIPLAINPARSMVIGVGSLTASITTNSTDATNQVATDTPFTTSGSGTAGAVDITIAGNTVTVASVTNGGEGYKVGDTLTFSTADIGGTEDVIITLVADDLVAVEGSDLNSFQLIPVDDVAFVKPISATSAEIQTMLWDISAGRALKWTVTVDDVPASTEPQLAADLSAAINAASQAENSIPVVSFYNNAEVIDVDYS